METRERVLTVEQILRNARRPLSVYDIIRILKKQYNAHATYPTVRGDIDVLSHFLYLQEDKGKFWISKE